MYIESAQTVDFGDGTWQQQERHNQLKLRNLRKDKRRGDGVKK
eukprot:COSAG01_NODE_6800_length_3493_cov_8.005009_1_plen_43_part_00